MEDEQRRYSVENARRHGLFLVGKAAGFNCIYCLGFSPSEKMPVSPRTVFTTHYLYPIAWGPGKANNRYFPFSQFISENLYDLKDFLNNRYPFIPEKF